MECKGNSVNKAFRLDFRTKLILTIVISYTLMLGNLEERYAAAAVGASLLPYLLFLMEKQYRAALKGILLTLSAFLARFYFMQGSSGVMHSLFLFMAMVFLRMLPGVMMGKYMLVTSEIGEIAYCMKKMKFPDELIIPMTVMSRFFRTVKEDYRQIRNAMRIHGLYGWRMILKPIRLIEYRLVPLLMIVTKTADDVAVSAMTRGMMPGKERTYFRDSRPGICDAVCFLIAAGLVLLYVKSKYI